MWNESGPNKRKQDIPSDQAIPSEHFLVWTGFLQNASSQNSEYDRDYYSSNQDPLKVAGPSAAANGSSKRSSHKRTVSDNYCEKGVTTGMLSTTYKPFSPHMASPVSLWANR